MNTVNNDSFSNLSDWFMNQDFKTSINMVKRNDFFCNDDIISYDDDSNTVNKTIANNYMYNYLYFLEKCIKELDYSFSFSDYNNVYELKGYINTIENIDLFVFMDWFITEGVVYVREFLKSLELNSYSSGDMYNIMKYYNYLIDSCSDDIITKTTFLTECITEVFIKINKFGAVI